MTVYSDSLEKIEEVRDHLYSTPNNPYVDATTLLDDETGELIPLSVPGDGDV